MYFTHAAYCLATLLVLTLHGGMPRQPASNTTPETMKGDNSSKAEIAKKLIATMTSSPCLHVIAEETFRDQQFKINIWMTPTKSKGYVRHEGNLVFATCVNDGRVQEFAPKVTFKNGTEATNVLISYDATDGVGFDEWPRLVDTDFACGPGSTADSWTKASHPAVPDMMAETLQADPDLKLTTIRGIDCFWMHYVQEVGTSTLTKDLYINRRTFEPVRQGNVVSEGNKIIKSDYVDYTIEHLPNDSGIYWGLEIDKLKADAGGTPKADLPKSPETKSAEPAISKPTSK